MTKSKLTFTIKRDGSLTGVDLFRIEGWYPERNKIVEISRLTGAKALYEVMAQTADEIKRATGHEVAFEII